MSKAREQLKSEVTRKRIRELLGFGWSLSKISKMTGTSYAHVKNIAEQERAALRAARGME